MYNITDLVNKANTIHTFQIKKRIINQYLIHILPLPTKQCISCESPLCIPIFTQINMFLHVSTSQPHTPIITSSIYTLLSLFYFSSCSYKPSTYFQCPSFLYTHISKLFIHLSSKINSHLYGVDQLHSASYYTHMLNLCSLRYSEQRFLNYYNT